MSAQASLAGCSIWFKVWERSQGEAITSSNKLDGVGFTGSIETGKRIAERQADKLTHFVFELGGNGLIIVLEDADMAVAARTVAESCYGNSGQDCKAGERVLVLNEAYDEFVQQIEANTRDWRVGDPLKPDTRIGPLVEESIASDADRLVSDAVERGAKVRTGGGRATERQVFRQICNIRLQSLSISLPTC